MLGSTQACRPNQPRFRHWYGTQLFAVGTDLPTARAQMGHHSATFTANVYGHADPRRAREAGEKVGALLWTR